MFEVAAFAVYKNVHGVYDTDITFRVDLQASTKDTKSCCADAATREGWGILVVGTRDAGRVLI